MAVPPIRNRRPVGSIRSRLGGPARLGVGTPSVGRPLDPNFVARQVARNHAALLATLSKPSRRDPEPMEEAAAAVLEIPLLVQSVVTTVAPVPEGALVTTVAPVWRGLLRVLAGNPKALHELSPRQLEEIVAASYEEAGFDEVILTPRSGDFGRDVIAVRRGFCTVRIIDQVKHFAPDRTVDANDVRALLGVLHADERATKGFVTTTAGFAPGIRSDPFIAKYMPYRLELVDGEALLERLLANAGHDPSPEA